ncbi:hypothetical protein L210DRAFT_3640115 [Boletus edulis BED1]|uniref:Zinc knuckle domain-containing protein n=1 Tax=Boletus edulis BED1 TaxID=1328754 RepID=A0AAD4C8X9_BOLED|nr:hypothetical protein L210DRAFT_3640115 [Boletus edulis BED1]
MTNATLNAIVDYAHHDKIQTAQDLRRETGWTRTDQFGDEIIVFIQRHAPPRPSPFVSTPLRITAPLHPSSIALNIASPSPVVKRRNKCSACGQEGHNARSKNCPARQVDNAAKGKENVSGATLLSLHDDDWFPTT